MTGKRTMRQMGDSSVRQIICFKCLLVIALA